LALVLARCVLVLGEVERASGAVRELVEVVVDGEAGCERIVIGGVG
jgi:hypothetical protein